jgi:hypothetical protein
MQASFKEMSQESSVMTFVLLIPDLQYDIISILIKLYLDSEAENYLCSLYLEDMKVPTNAIFDFNCQWHFRYD